MATTKWFHCDRNPAAFREAEALILDWLTHDLITLRELDVNIRTLKARGGNDAALADYLMAVVQDWDTTERAKQQAWLDRGV